MRATDFARELHRYFRLYLPNERGCSPQTLYSYQQAFSQFLMYMSDEQNIKPEKMEMKHFSVENVNGFLNWLEGTNHCSVSTRNHRLAVIRSFASFVKYDCPAHLEDCTKILSIRFKKAVQGEMLYLKPEGVKLILEQTDRSTSAGRRDFLMISLFFSVGLRVSEIINLRARDISFNTPKTITIHGKGNKIRMVPMMKQIESPLKEYFDETGISLPEKLNEFVFRSHLKRQMTRQGVFYTVRKYAEKARLMDPILVPEGVGCHTLRHSAAMAYVNSGVDMIYIRDLLGHVSVQTTEIYARADSEAKRKAIESTAVDYVPKEEAIWETDKSVMDFVKSLFKYNIM